MRQKRKKDSKKVSIDWKATILFSALVGLVVALFALFFTAIFEEWLNNFLDPNISYFINQFLQFFLLSLLMVLVAYFLFKRMRNKDNTMTPWGVS